MKPMSPEDRELEKVASEVSEHYRASAPDEPPARLDAAILAASRREVEVEPPRQRRNWQMPASIAAMLVLGVSLVLVVRDNEPPLSSLERPASEEAKLAKAAPPQLAMKAQPRANADFHREARPSRERSDRPDREPVVRDEVASIQQNTAQQNAAQENVAKEAAASGAPAQPVPASAAPAVAPPTAADGVAPAKPVEQEKSRDSVIGELSARKKAEASSQVAAQSGRAHEGSEKQDVAAVPVRPQDWLRSIDDLLRDGKDDAAREQLLGFRKKFPQYRLPERLQALLPPDQR